MPLALADFVHRWKAFAQTENAGSQSHFNNLCDLLGQPEPAAADSAGERYAFEKYVGKAHGGKGFADVWFLDHFAWEYKGKHKDLVKAYAQLNDYREELGNPPLLVVCDLDRFEVHTNFTNTSKRVYAFNLDDLNRNQIIATCPLLRALFGDFRTSASFTSGVTPAPRFNFCPVFHREQNGQTRRPLEFECESWTRSPSSSEASGCRESAGKTLVPRWWSGDSCIRWGSATASTFASFPVRRTSFFQDFARSSLCTDAFGTGTQIAISPASQNPDWASGYQNWKGIKLVTWKM